VRGDQAEPVHCSATGWPRLSWPTTTQLIPVEQETSEGVTPGGGDKADQYDPFQVASVVKAVLC